MSKQCWDQSLSLLLGPLEPELGALCYSIMNHPGMVFLPDGVDIFRGDRPADEADTPYCKKWRRAEKNRWRQLSRGERVDIRKR